MSCPSVSIKDQSWRVVRQVNERIFSSRKISTKIAGFPIPYTEEAYQPLLKSLDSAKQVMLLYHQTMMYRVRNAVQSAAKLLGDPYDDIIARHAACLKFKNRGECGEMAYAAASQCVEFSPTFYLVFNGRRNSHAVTVLSEESETVIKYIEECYYSKKIF